MTTASHEARLSTLERYGFLHGSVYMDEYGNVIVGAANIAAFPTDRAGQLSDIYVAGGATFTPPPAGIEVHGLVVEQDATVDLSGMVAGSINAFRFGPGSTVTIDTVQSCVLANGELAAAGTITFSAGSGPAVNTLSGYLSYVLRTDSGAGHWTLTGYYGSSTFSPGLAVYNQDATPTTAKNLSVTGFGSVAVNKVKAVTSISGFAGPFVYIQDTGSAQNVNCEIGTLSGGGQLTLSSQQNTISVNQLHTDGEVTLNSASGTVTVQTTRVEAGAVLSAVVTGNCVIDHCLVASGATLSVTGSGADVSYSTVDTGATLTVTGNSVVVGTYVGQQAAITTDGFDMTNVVIAWSGSTTLTANLTEAWESYSPNIAGITEGSGTLVARWRRGIDRTIHWFVIFTMAADSSVTGHIQIPLPVTAAYTYGGTITASGWDAAPGADVLLYAAFSTTTAFLYAINTGGTYAAATATSATVPITWTTSDIVYAAGTYEAAA